MGNVSPLEEDDKTQEFVMALDMFKNAKGTADEKKAREYLKKISKQSIGVELPIDTDMDGDVDNMDEQQLKLDFPKDLRDLSFAQKSKLLNNALKNYREANSPGSKKAAINDLVKVSRSIGANIDVSDIMEDNSEKNEYGTGIKRDEQIAAKKMAAKREEIYEKYANKYGVDVNEIKDRLEAYKLEKEAIEVEDEDTAIAVQKKSPDADVRIIGK